MNNTVVVVSIVVLASLSVFLLMKTYKNEKQFIREINLLNQKIDKKNDSSNLDRLKKEYENYKPPESSVAEDLKKEIDNLVSDEKNLKDPNESCELNEDALQEDENDALQEDDANDDYANKEDDALQEEVELVEESHDDVQEEDNFEPVIISNVVEAVYKNINFENLDSMTLKELQNYARENNIKIKGRKTDLIDRIKEQTL